MSKRKPPSQRPERQGSPEPKSDKDPTHAEMRRLVDQHAGMLKSIWDRRQNGSDILVLADVRRAEMRPYAEDFWEAAAIRSALASSKKSGERPMLAFLQPSAFADGLRRSQNWAHRECGKELQAFVRLATATPGLVPLLVVFTGGLWSTQWADPDSNVGVIRYEPTVTAEWN